MRYLPLQGWARTASTNRALVRPSKRVPAAMRGPTAGPPAIAWPSAWATHVGGMRSAAWKRVTIRQNLPQMVS